MPNIENWSKSSREKDVWYFRLANITARIEGDRGRWRGIIIDKEFDRLGYDFTRPKYIETKKHLIQMMKIVNKKIKLQPAVVI
jgi:hypothetical protein